MTYLTDARLRALGRQLDAGVSAPGAPQKPVAAFARDYLPPGSDDRRPVGEFPLIGMRRRRRERRAARAASADAK